MWAALLLGTGARAQHRPAAAAPLPTGQPLTEALAPDGSLRPGVSSSFDATGYRMGTDPETGAPVFRTAGPGDQHWRDGFGVPGIAGTVSALAIAPKGAVYAGGEFGAAGLIPANCVAEWDGSTWSALGAGTDGRVSALAVSGTDLYVGGEFSTAGGIAASRGAKWDGSTWSTVGTGLNGLVSSLTIANNKVYVGGRFTTTGDGSKVTAYFGIYGPLYLSAPSPFAAQPTFHLYPNPAHGTVSLSGARAEEATLLDLTGRLVHTVRLPPGAASISLAGVAPGVYVVRCGTATRRLVVE